jgi:hypothetical protein
MESAPRDDKDLMEAVIEAHPAARTTYELARQLSELLPIESLDDFASDARISVGGRELPAKDVAPSLPAELFPIRDQADLVRKLAAVVRVSGHVFQNEGPVNAAEEHRRVAFELAAASGGMRQVGVGVFRGPPILEVTDEPEQRS